MLITMQMLFMTDQEMWAKINLYVIVRDRVHLTSIVSPRCPWTRRFSAMHSNFPYFWIPTWRCITSGVLFCGILRWVASMMSYVSPRETFAIIIRIVWIVSTNRIAASWNLTSAKTMHTMVSMAYASQKNMGSMVSDTTPFWRKGDQ
jgi:hypothetical protein